MKAKQFPISGLLILIFTLIPSYLNADFYEWTDKKGNLHFSDIPPSPEERSGKIRVHKTEERKEPVSQKKKVPSEGSFGEATDTTVPSPSEDTPPEKEKRAYSDINVIIYTTSWCGSCKKAKEYLKSLGVNYTEYNVGRNKDKKKEQLEKSGGYGGVPLKVLLS
jgi:glutaredoxin